MTRRLQLKNGLTVVMHPMHEAPVVAVQAWVNVGAADEPEGFFGAAHLHEHMLFKGTHKRGVGEIARCIEGAGGAINAWTSFDQTVYHVVMASAELHTGLDVLSDALQNSTFDTLELEREIEVVLEEIRRAQDTPARRMSNALFETAYSRHPYRRTVLGTIDNVKALSRKKLLDFYHRFYGPQHTTLILTGDFQQDAAEAYLQELFSDWKQSTGTKADRVDEPRQTETRVQILPEDVPQSRLGLAWQIPAQAHHDIAAIDVLSLLLSHGEAGRLWRRLHRGAEFFTDVYAYAYTPKSPGLFMVGGGVRDEVCVRTALKALLHELEAVKTDLPAADELERARRLLLSEAAYQRETVQGMARKLGYYETVAGGFAAEEKYYAALHGLSAEDVRGVARRYLSDPPSVVLQAPRERRSTGDADKIPPLRSVEGAVQATHTRKTGEFELRTAVPDVADLATVVEEAMGSISATEPLTDASVVSSTTQSNEAVHATPLQKSGRKRRANTADEVTETRLSCGTRVLFKPEDGPITSFRAVALGGLRYETADSRGQQQLVMSLLAQGTEDHSAEAFSHEVSMRGGTISAFCGRNTMGMRGDFVSEHGVAGAQLFAEALCRSSFGDDDLERERQVQFKRIDRRKDHGASVAVDAFLAAVFPTHPFGRSPLGTKSTLEMLSLETARTLMQGFLHPEGLVVAIAGAAGSSEDALLAELERGLEGVRGETMVRTAPQHDSAPKRQQHTITLQKEQSHLVMGSMGTTVDDISRYGLETLCAVLSGQGGRLFVDLRDRLSLAYSISCSNLEAADPGYVMVHMGTSPEKMDEAKEGVHGHLRRIREELVSEDELARAKRYLVGTHAVDLQRAGARAMLMALGETLGLGHAHYLHFAERVAKVNTLAVRQAAQHFLSEERLVEIVAGSGG